jgi:hypothetical protein
MATSPSSAHAPVARASTGVGNLFRPGERGRDSPLRRVATPPVLVVGDPLPVRLSRSRANGRTG